MVISISLNVKYWQINFSCLLTFLALYDFSYFKKHSLGAGEKALTTLTENPGSVANINMAAHNCVTPVSVEPTVLPRHTCRQNPNGHKIEKEIIRKKRKVL